MQEPVTLSEMREHLGITQSNDTSRNFVIEGYITAARQKVEDYLQRAVVQHVCKAYAATFPETEIWLKSPVQSVTLIKYIDQAGIWQTLDPSVYDVDLKRARVCLADGQQWPAVKTVPNSIVVEYVCGYASVPQKIKEAIKFIVVQWEQFYRTSETIIRPPTLPHAAMQLLIADVDWSAPKKDDFFIHEFAGFVEPTGPIVDPLHLQDLSGDYLYDLAGEPLLSLG